MLAEEQTSLLPGEVSDPNANVINDGRWVPSTTGGDVLTSRHGKKANIGFADGHAAPVKYTFGRDLDNSLPNR